MIGAVFFSVCAIVCVVGAIATIASRNPIRAAVGLLATIMGIAGLFLKLAAEFLAAIQLIVYAGAVVVLFVFVIMLLGPDARLPDKPGEVRFSRWAAAILMVLLSAGAVFGLRTGWGPSTPLHAVRSDHGTTEAVGHLLFTQGIVPFEIATALLIVAVVGAIAVARSRPGKRKADIVGHEGKKLFAGPIHPRDAEHPIPKGGQ